MEAARKLLPTPPFPLPIVHNLFLDGLIDSLDGTNPLIGRWNDELYLRPGGRDSWLGL
jgi:hypothetical protein